METQEDSKERELRELVEGIANNIEGIIRLAEVEKDPERIVNLTNFSSCRSNPSLAGCSVDLDLHDSRVGQMVIRYDPTNGRSYEISLLTEPDYKQPGD